MSHYRIALQKSLPRPTIYRQKSAPPGGEIIYGAGDILIRGDYQIRDYLFPGGFLWGRHFNKPEQWWRRSPDDVNTRSQPIGSRCNWLAIDYAQCCCAAAEAGFQATATRTQYARPTAHGYGTKGTATARRPTQLSSAQQTTGCDACHPGHHSTALNSKAGLAQ